MPMDTDGDGIPDYQDTDSDNDGIADFRDPDSDGDGTDDGDENPHLNGDGIVDFLQPAELSWKTATMGSIGPLSFWEFALLLITAGTLWFVRRRSGHKT